IHADEDLQAALNAAKPGDELRLEAGSLFTGNFVLPAKSGDGTITLRTDLPDASLPSADTRVTPQMASRFARLESPNGQPALTTAPGAHNWSLLCLEFRANKGGSGEIIQLGDGSSPESSHVPRDLLLDRVYVHGDSRTGQKRGIAL